MLSPYWRQCPWPWHSSSPATAIASSGYNIDFVNNKDEVSYAYFLDDPYIISRLVVDNSGLLQQLMWNEVDLQWKETWSVPKYRCDKYGQCGAYSKCKPENSNRFDCMCLPGYEPKSPRDWYLRDGSEGCVREKLGMSMCGNGEGFVKMQHLKGPDSANAAWMDMSMSSSECEQACLSNCSCTAFISIDIDGKGTGCLAWYGELVDILENSDEGWDLNIRVDASELGSYLFLLSFSLCICFTIFISSYCTFGSWTHCLFYFPFQPSIRGSPKVFVATRGCWLLQYCVLLCHFFWYPC